MVSGVLAGRSRQGTAAREFSGNPRQKLCFVPMHTQLIPCSQAQTGKHWGRQQCLGNSCPQPRAGMSQLGTDWAGPCSRHSCCCSCSKGRAAACSRISGCIGWGWDGPSSLSFHHIHFPEVKGPQRSFGQVLFKFYLHSWACAETSQRLFLGISHSSRPGVSLLIIILNAATCC